MHTSTQIDVFSNGDLVFDVGANIGKKAAQFLARGASRPRYCKIDVEGFEMSVLRGLTQAVDVLSFEFTKEFIGNAATAVSYLNGIGMSEFTVALGENDFFSVDGWVDGHLLVDAISRHDHPLLWGDLYARRPMRATTPDR